MMRSTLIGVSRADHYSPNHIENDALILELTVRRLRELGYRVECCDEAQFVSRPVGSAAGVFGMARGAAAVERLQAWERAGCTVVNSGEGIARCNREPMTRLLLANGIPHPESLIVSTEERIVELLKRAGIRNGWLKRGDHTIHREDVSYFRHPEEAQEMLREYVLRGIGRAVVNRHLEGDLVKFYGVAGTSFFYWFYPYERQHSKFGYEQVNGFAAGYPFSAETLRRLCDRAAALLEVRVYGGDGIVSGDGHVDLIDFNDWPSFAPCREEASLHIARCIDAGVRRVPAAVQPNSVRHPSPFL